MTTHRTRPESSNKAEQEVALAHLRPLTGRWNLELSVPTNPPTILRDLWSTFDWMEGGLFLIWRWGPARSDFPGLFFPSALSVIGYDNSMEQYFVHYFDSRGVYRILDMAKVNGGWKMWRTSPDFSQRMTLTLNDDSRAMSALLERSIEGEKWDHDFDMTFTKVT